MMNVVKAFKIYTRSLKLFPYKKQSLPFTPFAYVLQNIGVLKNFAKFIGNHLCWTHFLIKLQTVGLQFYSKVTPAQVFSCEFWEILKKNFSKEHLWTTAFCLCPLKMLWLLNSLRYRI